MAANAVIAGVDEAGRGALAGPVVAGACVVLPELFRRRKRFHWSPYKRKPEADCLIADSKMLEPAQRELSYSWIAEHCVWGVGVVLAEEIDAVGILRANERAMRLAVTMLQERLQPTLLLVDGNDRYSFAVPHRSIIRGDQSEPCIAAASILAKVTRDRIMRSHRTLYPEYGFEGHKGYGSAEHIDAIRRHGPCPLHRKTFLTSILHEQLTLPV
jgi:ribonuclease HII